MDKIYMPNHNNLLRGKGELVAVDTSEGRRICSSLSDYIVSKKIYTPIIKETKEYLPDIEIDFARFVRYDVSDPKAEIALGKGTELSVANSNPSWNYRYKEKSCRNNDREQNEYFYFTGDKKQNWPLDHSIVTQKTLEWKAHLETVPERKSEGRGVIYTW
jgi:hypothetical protein